MKKDRTLAELLTGIVGVGLVEQMVCLLFWGDKFHNAVGLWCGIAICIGIVSHIQRTLEAGLELGGEMAARHIRKASMFRMLAACVWISVVLVLDLGNPKTLVAGILALKMAAYLQPFIHRQFQKKRERRGTE